MAIDAGMALRKLLVDDAAVSALVSRRIRPQKVGQRDAKPYMVYRTISGVREGHLTGTALVNKALIQIDGFADTEDEIVDMVSAVRKELDGRIRTSVTLSSNTIIVSIFLQDERRRLVRSLDGSDDGEYGFQLDFLVMHQEAA